MNYYDILLSKKLNGGGGGDITVESLSVTENGTYTAPSGKAYSPVTVEVEPPENSYQLKSITTPTSLATFEASAMPMPSLKVSVEAKQDLHGYDKPWVGGSGKNKLPLTVDGIKAANTNGTWSGNVYTYNGDTFTLITDADNNITAIKVSKSGTHTGTSYISFNLADFDFTQGTNYIVNGVDDGASTSTYRINVEGVGNFYNGDNAIAGDGATHKVRIQTSYNSTAVTTIIYPMIRLATESDATFAPYSNICPISGWDAAKVSDVGKNLFDKNNVNEINGYVSASNGTLEQGTSEHSIYLWLPKGTYAFQRIIPSTDATTKRFRVRRYDNVPQVGDVGDVVADYNDELTGTFTTNKDGYVLIFMFNGSSAWNARQEVFDSIQIEEGSTATTYEPYNGVTATIALGQTVYGGEVDVVNGTSGNKITYGFVDLGDLNYTRTTDVEEYVSFRATVSDKAQNYNYICSQYKTVEKSRAELENGDIGTYNTSNARNVICIRDDSKSSMTAEEFKSAMSGVQLVYELARPTTLATQPTPIKSLNGQNNLSVDCGEVLEGEYFIAL